MYTGVDIGHPIQIGILTELAQVRVLFAHTPAAPSVTCCTLYVIDDAVRSLYGVSFHSSLVDGVVGRRLDRHVIVDHALFALAGSVW